MARWKIRRIRRICNIINFALVAVLLVLAISQGAAIHNLREEVKGGTPVAMICVNGCRECTGCMQCQADPEPIYCDVCGKEVEHLYKNEAGDVVGCDRCIKVVDPYCE